MKRPVQVTVPMTMPHRTLNPVEVVYVNRVFSHHDQPIRDHVSSACLTCATITVHESQEQRDLCVDNFDFTCCDTDTTIFFRTRGI